MKVIGKILLTVTISLFTAEIYAFNCSVTTTPVTFGNYDVLSASPLNSTGTVSINCNNPEKRPMPISLAISSGGSGTFNPRQMKAAIGTDRMNYYLFTDPARTIIWGDGTGGTSLVTGVITKTDVLNTTIYGKVPARQNIRAGSYSDSLIVTVNW